jgi:hypothetical protein
MTLLGLGTGTFMLAVAASDVTVSLGGHRQMATAWVVGLAAATLSVIPLPDLLLRATVPLIVGSTVVALVLLRAARARVVALHPVGV